jgi:hypothetical protein
MALCLKLAFLSFFAFVSGDPNFSGTWIRNVEKSTKMATFQNGKTLTINADLVIKHSGATIYVQENCDYKPPTNLVYTVDGQNHEQGEDTAYKAQFDGETLKITEITSGGGFGGSSVSTLKTWALSTDGKILTITTTINSSALGKVVQTQIYNKKD